MSSAIELLRNFELFILGMRNREYQLYLHKAKSFLDSMKQQFKDEMKRKQKRTRRAGQSTKQKEELAGAEKIYVSTYLLIIDSVQSELSMRKTSYDIIDERFGFICALRAEEILKDARC